MSDYSEQGLVFDCGDHRLVGIAALPPSPATTGVLILVGGPQYRVGSHRQFTLLARDLATHGIPSLRFDYSGMGDSEGVVQGVDQIEQDIGAAIDALFSAVPGLSRVILWGLCDAASSAMMYAHRQDRVAGMVLLNPWVHGGDYSPEVKLAHYYRPLLLGGDYWRRLFTGKIKVLPALREFATAFVSLIGKRSGGVFKKPAGQSFIQAMLQGMRHFEHDILVILSDDDLTAKEYINLVAADKEWRELMSRPGVTTETLAGADHTFSSRAWKDQVSGLTIDWVRQHQA